jgi:hypothetical protein
MKIQFVQSHSRELGYEASIPNEAVTLNYGFGMTGRSDAGDVSAYLKSSIVVVLSVSGGKTLSNVNLS